MEKNLLDYLLQYGVLGLWTFILLLEKYKYINNITNIMQEVKYILKEIKNLNKNTTDIMIKLLKDNRKDK